MSHDDAAYFACKVRYPVLVRPSFVLSGAKMHFTSNELQLRNFLLLVSTICNNKPVVLTKFILDVKEIEFDAIAQKGVILNYVIGEHLENIGVHYGDAKVIVLGQKLYVNTIRQVKQYSTAIVHALKITVAFNI